MTTATKSKPIIINFENLEKPELLMEESRSYEDRETEYTFMSFAEPDAMLKRRLSNIEGIKRVCLTHEDFVTHVWILIEREDWEIRERIYNAEYDIYLSEFSAFRFNFHVSEERELSDCVPLFGS
jgi:hypothetical protein